MNNTEKISFDPDKEIAPDESSLDQIAAEQHDALRRQHEMHEAIEEERSSPEKISDARHEALKRAQSLEKQELRHSAERQLSPAEKRNSRGSVGKAERDASFDTTMHEVQDQMSAPSRAFSKVIHNKVVEAVSATAASTIARPNALLAGAFCAFILTLVVYLVAKNLGYPLSGFETIGAFLLGWIIGIVYDFLRTMVTGRKV
jgi:hypothetical protein